MVKRKMVKRKLVKTPKKNEVQKPSKEGRFEVDK
jgi:hypothetical protein